MPMVWCIGSIIGPMIGGALARRSIGSTVHQLSGTVPSGQRMGAVSLPIFFPTCSVPPPSSSASSFGFLFLEETHATQKLRRDRGRELGSRIVALFRKRTVKNCPKGPLEKQCLLAADASSKAGYGAHNGCTQGDVAMRDEEEPLPAYWSRENSPKLAPQARPGRMTAGTGQSQPGKGARIFTRPVVMNIISYGILAFHTMTFDQLFPVFLSTSPPTYTVTELPFKFVGGFGLDTKTIGVIMSAQGVYSLLSNYVVVQPVTRRFGSLRLFRMLAFSYFALYVVTPYLVLLPERLRMPVVYVLVIWKCTYATMAYPNNAILLANSAPDKQVLGTINGIAASTASLCRALGPTLSGILYAVGLRTGYSGLAWWFSGLVTVAGAYLSSRLTGRDQACRG